MRWEGHIARMGQVRDKYRILIREHEIEWEDMNWIHVTQDSDQ
jgi:hypothetical protein